MVLYLSRTCRIRVTWDAVIAHRYTYAPLRCRTMQYRRTFIHQSVFSWNDLGNLVFNGVGLAVFKSRTNEFHWPSCSYCFPFLFLYSVGWYCAAGVFGLIGC